MFGDNDAIKHFSLSMKKCSYLVLAPYFKDKLLLAIKVSLVYSVLFDYTVNLALREEQMKIYIGFWDSENSLSLNSSSQDNLYQ